MRTLRETMAKVELLTRTASLAGADFTGNGEYGVKVRRGGGASGVERVHTVLFGPRRRGPLSRGSAGSVLRFGDLKLQRRNQLHRSAAHPSTPLINNLPANTLPPPDLQQGQHPALPQPAAGPQHPGAAGGLRLLCLHHGRNHRGRKVKGPVRCVRCLAQSVVLPAQRAHSAHSTPTVHVANASPAAAPACTLWAPR